MLRTRICDLFGIEVPLLNAPMGGGDAPAELAAAVSNVGGLGMIGGTTIGGVDWLVDQIRIARWSHRPPVRRGSDQSSPERGRAR